MKNKIILIIGGTGSWGRGLIKQLLNEDIKKIKVFARNEFQMVSLMQSFNSSKIEIIIGDIRDEKALINACKDVEIIYHLAALKHVPICEKMPYEAIETNVIGTKNVIEAAIKNNVDKIIYASTDKAVNADCTYGSTKLLGEKLILAANEESRKSKFIVFRGGNLLGSAGSVIPLFKNQIAESGVVTLTDERMKRYFISIERAAKLLVEISKKAAGGEIFIPKMPSVYIKDVAKYLLCKNGISENKIAVTGIRPGEKLYEELISDNEKDFIYYFSDDLFLVSKNDNHGWAANNIIEKCESYLSEANKATLDYDKAFEFLSEVGV